MLHSKHALNDSRGADFCSKCIFLGISEGDPSNRYSGQKDREYISRRTLHYLTEQAYLQFPIIRFETLATIEHWQ